MAIGARDYYQYVQPALPEPPTDQVRFSWVEGVTVSAGSSSTGTVYTVPSGKKLFITNIVVSCEASCIQRVSININTTSIFISEYDIRAEWVLPAGTGLWLTAGEALGRSLTNNDTSSRYIMITLRGYQVNA